jgi:hypothetical protein
MFQHKEEQSENDSIPLPMVMFLKLNEKIVAIFIPPQYRRDE